MEKTNSDGELRQKLISQKYLFLITRNVFRKVFYVLGSMKKV
jgi:hypothetical protein